jgi:hypothetical protein
MFTHIRSMPRFATAVLGALALLTAACSDATSPGTSPARFSTAMAASSFAVLANASVTCTDGTISGDVGTFLATPSGSVSPSNCPIAGAVHVGDSAATQAFNDFLNAYSALAPWPGEVCTTLTGTLAGVTLAPGAYCFDAAATVTGVLTLDGPADGVWTFKIGMGDTGALTGTNFSVVMAGGAQSSNVTWRVAQGVTLTDSHMLGMLLGGADITLTRGTLDGNAFAKADVTITGTAVTGRANNGGAQQPVLTTITVTPNSDTLAANATQQFSAVGQDAGGNSIAIAPTWSVVANGGSISNTGLFTAGAVAGTFTNTVQANDGSVSGFATVVVTVVVSPPPPVVAAPFAVLANTAVTCTNGNISGNVGTFFATPTGSITRSGCPVSGTLQVGDSAAQQSFNDFLNTYATLAPKGGDVCTTLTGTLAGVTLSPGVYCFDAAATVTGVLTLDGPADGIWTFKIGTSGTGALTGSSFSVVMAGGAQPGNVTWWVAQGVTMTDSHFIGTVLGGADITLTRGTFDGNVKAKADVTITGTALVGGSN